MRLNIPRRLGWGRWIVIAFMLVGFAPGALAAGPQAAVPGTCGAAASLGLALLAALQGGRR